MFSRGKHQITVKNAESLAVEAFTFLGADEDRLNGFLSHAGLDLSELGVAARQPYFFEAVMDYLTLSDEMVLEFAQATGHAPQDAAYVVQFYKQEQNL